MHPALRLPELLGQIFGYLGTFDTTPTLPSRAPSGTVSPRRNSTLAGLARTCKPFKKPAIDELWEEVTALRIYESLIPHLLIKRKDEGLDVAAPSNWIADVISLSPAEQRNVMEYTTSIRKLDFNWVNSTAIASPALHALSSLPGGAEATFSRLDHVRASSYIPELLGAYVPFASRAVHLYLHGMDLHTALVEFMDKFTAVARPQGSFVLDIDLRYMAPGERRRKGQEHQMLLNRLSHAILRTGHLRTFSCPEVDQITLLHLSKLQSLVSLEFQILLDIGSTPKLAFPSLELLKLEPFNFLHAVFFISKLARIPPSIQIQSYDDPLAYLSNRLFGELSIHSTTNSLQVLVLKWNGYVDQDPHNIVVTMEIIQPLLVFTRLRVFDWIFPHRLQLTDTEVHTMSSAWPSIERLRIRSALHDFTPSATFNSVLTVAQHCPRLARFSLPIDVSRTEEFLGEGFCNDTLEVVELGTSAVDARGLAVITTALARTLPRLTSTELGVPVGPEDVASVIDEGRRRIGVHVQKAVESLRRAKEDGRIVSWSDEETQTTLIRYFEVTWDAVRKHEYADNQEILSRI
ncbi:hypothetical protein CONPUDRAFT_160992 [Coniophora puteana RWD-64-598 SS2]|uniref:F-box domain-containing protein n=1 Tax=Coniophora puteana (strain RWD-64-598) TaxID=741705 RepID=A0A5M3N413_CONPW|nr:uncharacterized protein CONPUDRAFT_160992 [Coniophora puteana RWD-64-598 SS2]EIW86169.1 hypothetical protein CONPUDRAFT_160992 [Coniophora puteana RWD-64-598 SS2]